MGIENYRTIFANKAFRLAAGNTLRFFGVCVPAAGGIVSDHSSPACRAEKIYADSEKFLSSANGNPCSISGTSVESCFLTNQGIIESSASYVICSDD